MKTRTLPTRVLTILFCAACLVLAVATAAKPKLAKTAAERRGLNFSHQLHTADQGLGCEICHSLATASQSGTDDLLPGHPQCQECHDVAENCALCHTGEPGLSERVVAYSPKFSHERHIGTAKIACGTCHRDLDESLDVEQLGHFPDMGTCMDCHADNRVANDCRTCHLPEEDLVPADHKVNWVYHHSAAADESQDACHVCHTADDCQRCHNGDAVFSPHPRNYISRHGQDAHLSDLSCGTCHDHREDCNSCHQQLGVIPAGHFQADWLTPSGGAHGERAEFDLESCMACHDAPGQEPVCARCHHE